MNDAPKQADAAVLEAIEHNCRYRTHLQQISQPAILTDGGILCPKCGATKRNADFYSRSDDPAKILVPCKDCRKAYSRAERGRGEDRRSER